MKHIVLSTGIFYGLLLLPAVAQTDTARELKQLQDEHDKAVSTAVAPIHHRYTDALETLLRRATQMNDADTANHVRAELQKYGVTASSTGAGPSSPLGQTDEVKRNTLRTHLRDSKWKLGNGGKSFELHADGSTSASWHGKKGYWKVTGPATAEIVITNSGAPKKITFDDEATTGTIDGDTGPETAKRILPGN